MDTEALIVDNVGLVYKQLHRFNMAYDEEAFSYAMEALMSAARTYDTSKGVKFSTYASVCIYNGIMQYIRVVNKARRLETVSYDEPIPEMPDLLLIETLGSDETPDQQLLADELKNRVRQAIKKVLAETANPKAVEAIEYWWSTDFIAQQGDIAARLGVSQGAVSRYLSAFKYKVKLELEDYLKK